jgi:hypothetical protein
MGSQVSSLVDIILKPLVIIVTPSLPEVARTASLRL